MNVYMSTIARTPSEREIVHITTNYMTHSLPRDHQCKTEIKFFYWFPLISTTNSSIIIYPS